MSEKFQTPVLLLIFNRPDVTQQVFDQIRLIQPTQLYVAADGPRPGNEKDIYDCAKTREIINQIDWDCELKTLFRKENLGCGYAVSSAISWFFEHVEAGIIFEDDCYPDLSFFQFCAELLIKYQNDPNIFVISGTNLQSGKKYGKESYYFSNYPITWGWASWRRAWKYFIHDINISAEEIDSTLYPIFQNPKEREFWTKRIQSVEKEKRNIWDYQWFYAIWKNKGMGITPEVNLIVNIGFRNNASHTFLKDSRREPSVSQPIEFPLRHPDKKINSKGDTFTFENAFSHSSARLFRLVKENGIFTVLRYATRKFLN